MVYVKPLQQAENLQKVPANEQTPWSTQLHRLTTTGIEIQKINNQLVYLERYY